MNETIKASDTQERIFTLSDVRRLFFDRRKQILKIAFLGAIASSLFTLIQQPKYKIEATFKEGAEKSGSESSLRDFLGGGGAGEPQAVVLMKSYRVLKPLAEKMGLQATVPNFDWIGKKICRRILENLKVNFGKPLADPDPFLFENVVYEEEAGASFFIRFSNPCSFSILSGDKKTELGRGEVGSEVHLQNLKFTLKKVPKNLRIRVLYPLSVSPWESVTKQLRDQLQIVSSKANKSIYDLSLFHRNRRLGVHILNELMLEYQRYLKKEHDILATEQLSYLEQRQSQLYGKMSLMLDEHAAYLTRNLQLKGFIGLEQETTSLLKPHEEMLAKILEIDLEIARLNQIEKEGKFFSLANENPFSQELSQIGNQLEEYKQQRDLIELSLQQQRSFFAQDEHLESRREEIREIRTHREAVQNFLGGGDSESPFGLSHSLSIWAQRIQESQESKEKKDLAEYLENYSRLLSLREKMLQERFFYGASVPSELQGIDLDTAKLLFAEYNSKLDQAEASIRHFAQLREATKRADFELGSLGSVLSDPFSQNLITDASELAVKLKDEKYHSGKEGERWREDLALKRMILSEHLEQLSKVEELNSSLIRKKIAGLQQASLDCINQQISVLREQASDAVKQRRENLIYEKQLLEKKMKEIRDLASDLPEKWRLEKWLELKTDLGLKMVDGLTQLVESKTIGHHLHHVESKPLDFATLPSSPISSGLFKMAFLGAFGFGSATFFLSLIRSILRGFPTSLDKLRAMGYPLLGSISFCCDGPSVETPNGSDLELLRKISLFLKDSSKGKVVGLIGGGGPDYTYALGENLSRISYKSIFLRCDFQSKSRREDGPGILQIWKREICELPIQTKNGVDFISAGGFTPFGAEVIQSLAFRDILEKLKSEYEGIFLFVRSPLSSVEAIAALKICDKGIVTVSGEQTEELTPFAAWAYHEGHCRLMFMTSDYS